MSLYFKAKRPGWWYTSACRCDRYIIMKQQQNQIKDNKYWSKLALKIQIKGNVPPMEIELWYRVHWISRKQLCRSSGTERDKNRILASVSDTPRSLCLVLQNKLQSLRLHHRGKGHLLGVDWVKGRVRVEYHWEVETWSVPWLNLGWVGLGWVSWSRETIYRGVLVSWWVKESWGSGREDTSFYIHIYDDMMFGDRGD